MMQIARFRCDERGSIYMFEFVLLFPLCLFFLISALELSWLGMRASMFERGVDFAMREIRLSTGAPPDYEQVKTIICDNAPAISDCDDHLRLEMIRVTPRNWDGTLVDATCTDQPEDIEPPTPLLVGLENDLMILRVCARLELLVPEFGLGAFIPTGSDDRFPLFSINAFVQEPI